MLAKSPLHISGARGDSYKDRLGIQGWKTDSHPYRIVHDSHKMSQSKKLILVIGATGAQGIAVIDALLAPSDDGTPSPYSVRALTRSPDSRRAQELTAKGVECVKGECAHIDSELTERVLIVSHPYLCRRLR